MHEEPTYLSSSETWKRKQEFFNSLKQARANQFYSKNTKPVTENKRYQHWVNPCNLGSLRCLDITVEGRWQKNTQIKPPAPEQRELRPMRLLIRAKVTQQLDSKLSPVQASGACASCSSTIPMSSGHFIRTPATQRQVKYNWPAQGEFIFLWTQMNQLPKIIPLNSKVRDKRILPHL